MRPLSLLCALLLAATASCSQRATPEDEYSEEDRTRPVVDPSRFEGPGEAPAVGTPEAAASSAADEDLDAQEIAGTIDGPGTVRPGAVLYVFVRPEGTTAGPPLAVRRRPAASFPVTFSISPRDAMMGAGAFPDRVTLQARLDSDGDAMTSGPDDWSARADAVEPGTSGIELELEPGG